MLAYLASKTTVHGVKEAYLASPIGRTFWAVIFSVFLVTIIVQLESMFVKYVGSASGTRMTPIPLSGSEYIDVPSIYYCNPMWFPNIKATKKLIDIDNYDPTPKRPYMTYEYEETTRYEANQLTCNIADKAYYEAQSTVFYDEMNISNADCEPYREYWRSWMIEDFINDLVMPRDLEKRRSSFLHGRQSRRIVPFQNDNRDILAELMDQIKKEHAGSLRQYIANVTRTVAEGETAPANGVYIEAPDDPIDEFPEYLKGDTVASFGGFDPLVSYRHLLTPPERYQWLFKSRGTLAVNLNGVCWEVQPGASSNRAKDAMGRFERHVVVHFGGYGHHLRVMAQKHGATAAFRHALQFALPDPETRHYTTATSTFVSIAGQSNTDLYFPDRIRLDEYHPFATVQYWTKKNVRLSTGKSPCRADGWTLLDQAHCNQNNGLNNNPNFTCRRYLPASAFFPETAISDRLCLSDHSSYFMDARNSFSPAAPAATFDFSRLDTRELHDVVSKLTKSSKGCPGPCTITKFDFEVTYTEPYPERLESDEKTRLFPCFYGTAALLRNTSDEGIISDLHDFAQKELVVCSVIDYQQTELYGMAYEEYALYNLPDLASNLGGILGLWMGASVVSFVQAIYISCLERMLGKLDPRDGPKEEA